MGLTRAVVCERSLPAWTEVRGRLESAGLPLQLRMIDGQLAFPDEEPPAEWHELRLSVPAGMVTLRRAAERVEVVTWGNADSALQAAAATIAQILAELCGGTVVDG